MAARKTAAQKAASAAKGKATKEQNRAQKTADNTAGAPTSISQDPAFQMMMKRIEAQDAVLKALTSTNTKQKTAEKVRATKRPRTEPSWSEEEEGEEDENGADYDGTSDSFFGEEEFPDEEDSVDNASMLSNQSLRAKAVEPRSQRIFLDPTQYPKLTTVEMRRRAFAALEHYAEKCLSKAYGMSKHLLEAALKGVEEILMEQSFSSMIQKEGTQRSLTALIGGIFLAVSAVSGQNPTAVQYTANLLKGQQLPPLLRTAQKNTALAMRNQMALQEQQQKFRNDKKSNNNNYGSSQRKGFSQRKAGNGKPTAGK